jgi:uncharacterized protein YbaA (DUF1428 family)
LVAEADEAVLISRSWYDRPEQKIDAAVALMMAVGRAMAEDANEGDLTDFLRDPLFA